MSERRLILHMSISLDGFVAHRNGDIDWLAPRDDLGADRHQANLEMIGRLGLIVLGRGAYEQMAPAWQSSDSPMAQLMNRLPKVVFSDRLNEVQWENARLNKRPLQEEILELKGTPGGAIAVFGGGRLAHSLIRKRLVDEDRLTVHPVALGDGIPLMHGLPEPQRFRLVSATVYADGSIAQVLRPT